jgi:hypothetical protein
MNNEPDGSTVESLIALLAAQQALLISVATGGPQIDTVNAEYKRRHRALSSGLTRLGLTSPFPWRDLWEWYGRWSSGDLPSYASRRQYIRELSAPIDDELSRRLSSARLVDWGSDRQTWASLEARLDGLKKELDAATDLDDLQDVGRRAREIIIDAANLVFDISMVPDGDDPPKGSDAKRRIELFLDTRAAGTSHVELRRLIRAAWDLANSITHSSRVGRIDAFAAAQGTVVIVRCLQEIERAAGSD